MNRRFALFVVAFLVALAATGAVFVYVSDVDSRAVAGQQPVKVLVATHHVARGVPASELRAKGWLETRSLARSAVGDDALSTLTGSESRVTGTELFPGDVLTAAKLVAKATPNAGALTIPSGQLAVSVQVEDAESVAGFVRPGAEVAVFDTFNVAPASWGTDVPSGDRLQDNYLRDRATRLLLPRATVVAVGPQATGGKTSGAAADSKDTKTAVSVTLAVSQRDAERLIHAAETGSIWFGLLTDSSKTAPSAGVDNRRLFP